MESTGGAELEFKRVSAHANCAWGIGCDHMLYTYMHSTDVPIVKRVETYENQRWSPLSGYSGQLLPTGTFQKHRSMSYIRRDGKWRKWFQDYSTDNFDSMNGIILPFPQDRHHWSDDSGLVNKPKESFKLPSDSWVWEPNASGDDGWALDATCDGVPTVGMCIYTYSM